MSILVTGGAGYIGSHTCVTLLAEGYHVVILDNLSNSSKIVLRRIEQITGKQPVFYQADILDEDALRKIFEKENIEAVIHFAGWKAVAESEEQPLHYYHNNVSGILNLCMVMQEYGVKRLIFSSSATVYGDVLQMPITEESPIGSISNPYGKTKAMSEQILLDLCRSDSDWEVTVLRYFNPIGAHESGLIGESPKGVPNNLLPCIAQVAVGNLPYLNIYGDDYPTLDGTGVRDYIHVVELSQGHIAALRRMRTGFHVYNLGTGRGYSVLEMLHAYETVCGKTLPYRIQPRRKGDVAVSYCNATKAENELGWKAKKTLEDMCKDSFRWQEKNPNGYEEK